jgi:hypothetical protein
MLGIQQKSYLWVSSDNRTSNSRSTTSFNLRLQTPLQNVISVEVVKAGLEYKAPNILPKGSPSFVLNDLVLDPSTGDPVITPTTYEFHNLVHYPTPASVMEALQDILPSYIIRLVDDALVLELPMLKTVTPTVPEDHLLIVEDTEFQKILGMSKDTVFPVVDDDKQVIRWSFPRSLKIPKPPPFFFIQSQELGNDVISTAGNINFFRVFVGKPLGADPSILLDENQVISPVVTAPREINDIDVSVLLPDRTVLNNGDGSFSMLLEIVQTI